MTRLAWLLLVPGAAHAGPWTRDLGSFYAKLGVDGYVAFSFDDPRSQVTGGSYHGEQIGVYGEVGLTPKHPLQLAAFVPLSIGTLTFPPDGRTTFGRVAATTVRMGDVRLALQTRIPAGPAALSVAGEVKIPAYRNASVGEGWGAFAENFPWPGDGQVDVTGWVYLGGSFLDGRMWAELGVGYRHRTEAYLGADETPRLVDGVPFQLTVGGRVGRTLLMLQAQGIKNVIEDDVTRENVALGPAVMVDVWKQLAVEVRAAAEPWADNASQGVGFGVGLSYRTE